MMLAITHHIFIISLLFTDVNVLQSTTEALAALLLSFPAMLTVLLRGRVFNILKVYTNAIFVSLQTDLTWELRKEIN
jgi:hypothetical protein